MKKICLLACIVFVISLAGCSAKEDVFGRYPLGEQEVVLTGVVVPAAMPLWEAHPIAYRAYPTYRRDYDAFVFEEHYNYAGQNPVYTVFSLKKGEERTEIAKLEKADAQVVYAGVNSRGIYWSTLDYRTFCYLYSDKEIKALPIQSMTNFSLNEDYLLYMDAESGELSYLNLNDLTEHTIPGVSLINPYWIPNLYHNQALLFEQIDGGINVNFHDLSTNQLADTLQVKDKRIKNVLTVSGSDDWLVFVCLKNPEDYTGSFVYTLNRQSMEISMLEERVSSCEILSGNTLIYIRENIPYLYDMATGETVKMDLREMRLMPALSKRTENTVEMKSQDDSTTFIATIK